MSVSSAGIQLEVRNNTLLIYWFLLSLLPPFPFPLTIIEEGFPKNEIIYLENGGPKAFVDFAWERNPSSVFLPFLTGTVKVQFKSSVSFCKQTKGKTLSPKISSASVPV